MAAIDAFCDILKSHDILTAQYILDFNDDCRFCLLGDTINGLFYEQSGHVVQKYQLFVARQVTFFLCTIEESKIKMELSMSTDLRCNNICITFNTLHIRQDESIDAAISMFVIYARQRTDDIRSEYIKFKVKFDDNGATMVTEDERRILC